MNTINAPKVAKPKVVKPKVAKPKVVKPKVVKPKVAKPKVVKPKVVKPKVAKPIADVTDSRSLATTEQATEPSVHATELRENTVELLELSISRAELDFVLRAVSKDTVREILQYVCLTVWTNGMISICSTDTHRLHTVVLRPAQLVGGGLHPKSRILLSAERLVAISKMHKADAIAFMCTGDTLTDIQFVSFGKRGCASAKNLESANSFSAGYLRPENYPAVQRVVPMDTGIAIAPFAVNGKYVYDAMLSECNRVVISGTTPSRPLIVSDVALPNGNPWELRSFAVIMPMALVSA